MCRSWPRYTMAKAVLLSGRVLAHAVASLDSSATATLDTLEFGTVSQNSVTELSERLFNRSYSPLQARLVRNAEYVFTGSTSPASAPRG